MYPEIMVVPMREELTRLGIAELRTEADVDRAIPNQPGTTMVVVNSICGCAAGRMRPAVRAALQHSSRPERLFSVFAGQDKDATERARLRPKQLKCRAGRVRGGRPHLIRPASVR